MYNCLSDNANDAANWKDEPKVYVYYIVYLEVYIQKYRPVLVSKDTTSPEAKPIYKNTRTRL